MSSERDPRVALFGFPVGHSVSPAMHHAAAAALGIPLRYEALLTPPEALSGALDRLREAAWLGANVTVPHKQAASRLVDTLAPTAARLGAINTIYKRGTQLVGDNTDLGAVIRVLDEHFHLTRSDTVLLLGAGGAARACVAALAHFQVSRLLIWNRTPEAITTLLSDLSERGVLDLQSMEIIPVADARAAADHASLLINATSVGLDGRSLPLVSPALPAVRVFDLVYGVDGTPLVRTAQAQGLLALDGLWMLVYQAAAAFALWTGQKAPEDAMHRAALAVLAERRTQLQHASDPPGGAGQ
jgi:shikimate dehydrogenase